MKAAMQTEVLAMARRLAADERKRLSIRLGAFSTLLLNARLASEPSAVSREQLYQLNKMLSDISNGLADESRLLKQP